MTVTKLENLGVVVEDLSRTVEFFVRLGLTLIGQNTVGGDVVDRLVGLQGVQCDLAVVETADGLGRLEIMQFRSPPARGHGEQASVNTLGPRRIAFVVDDLDATLAGLEDAELLGETVRYGDSYRLDYVRGPEAIIVMLAESSG
jgi:catechol 2,3-dioxygenase-like lactoylglutathione lyase family enzyme